VKRDNKTLDNFIHQYKYAGNYVDRREAIEFAAKNQTDPKAVALLKTALNDPYQGLRSLAIARLDLKNEAIKTAAEPVLANLAKSDKYATVRAAAILALGNYKKAEYVPLFKSAVNDSSYTVAGRALGALSKVDSSAAITLAKQLSAKPAKGLLKSAIQSEFAKSGDESVFEKVLAEFETASMQEKFGIANDLSSFIISMKNTEKVKKGVEAIARFRDEVPAPLRSQTDPYLNGQILKGILTAKDAALKANSADAGLKEQVDFIKSKLPEEEKKGF
jgi:aminopeptidase N